MLVLCAGNGASIGDLVSDPLTVISRDLPGWAADVLFGVVAVAAIVGTVSAIAGPVTGLTIFNYGGYRVWSPGAW